MEDKNCQHNPLDRDLDVDGNQFCTICGRIMKTAEELYNEYTEEEDPEELDDHWKPYYYSN